MCKVRFKERLFIILFACFLAIYPPTVKYQEVQALEWAIPTVAFDTALKFLLGLLGVSITSKALHDNVDWNQVQQDAVNFQIQQGNDAVAVGEWWEDVANGTLNQASSCWSAFKEWVKSLIQTNNSTDNVTRYFVSSDNVFSLEPFYYYSVNLDYLNGEFYLDDNNYFTFVTVPHAERFTELNYIVGSGDGFMCPIFSSSSTFENNYITVAIHNKLNGTTVNKYCGATNFFRYSDKIANCASANGVAISSDDTKRAWISVFGDNVADSPNEGIFDSSNDNIQDTAITTGDTTTTAIPDTLPLPWDNVSDTAEGVSDAIDALQEQVAEGVLSLEEYWERVQEMVDALAIDTTTEEILPVTQNPDTGESEKLPDKVQENVSNTSFTLSGLEKVFPFCIPWDIYAFVTLLVAEPQAPVFQFPIYNPANHTTEYITVDMSAWESVAVLVRYIFDFLLIIGLLLLARSLIGAEG